MQPGDRCAIPGVGPGLVLEVTAGGWALAVATADLEPRGLTWVAPEHIFRAASGRYLRPSIAQREFTFTDNHRRMTEADDETGT